MQQDDRRSPSRYDTSGSENEYMDPEQTVLQNKKNIADLQKLHREEEKALGRAYEILLREVQSDTPITTELIRYAHGVIFGNLYTWAGRWRSVTISKPGVTWPPPDYLDEAMRMFEQEILPLYPASALHDDQAFCSALGHIQGEFLAIHPFREGNARTIKLCSNILAAQTDRPLLLFDETEAGKEAYILAAHHAIMKNYSPMTTIITDALRRSTRQP